VAAKKEASKWKHPLGRRMNVSKSYHRNYNKRSKNMEKVEKKKQREGEEIMLVDIPQTAKCRLEVILTTMNLDKVSRQRIVIGLDDGGGSLSLLEARRLAETVLEMSRPKFERLYGECFPYQVSLIMGRERHILITPLSERKENEWKFDEQEESEFPF
jgi:hypothetical protein